mmetsp:Transcript_22684/g.53785  ORF Transcript_22684/g.53785 Transcript_22684/m.53785 type:complete len:110 (+) Transcript_22684:227-556(+)
MRPMLPTQRSAAPRQCQWRSRTCVSSPHNHGRTGILATDPKGSAEQLKHRFLMHGLRENGHDELADGGVGYGWRTRRAKRRAGGRKGRRKHSSTRGDDDDDSKSSESSK